MFDKKRFLTIKEAEAWAAGENLRSLGFCPVINAVCKPTCVCFVDCKHMEMFGVSTKNYAVVAPGCSHPMIIGFMEIEGG